MITKQDLLNHLSKQTSDYIYKDDIIKFLESNDVTKIIGFTEGALFIDTDAPVKFSNATDLSSKLSELKLGKKVTATFNAVSKPSAAIALTVIRIFTETLGYKISKITSLKVDFEK